MKKYIQCNEGSSKFLDPNVSAVAWLADEVVVRLEEAVEDAEMSTGDYKTKKQISDPYYDESAQSPYVYRNATMQVQLREALNYARKLQKHVDKMEARIAELEDMLED